MPRAATPLETNGAGRLARVQRWMQACIVAEGPVEQAIRTAPAAKEIPACRAPELIRPSRTLAPLERLDIYRRMYELRLTEALRTDYPGLAHFLGEELFAELARLYITAHPSHSYTLNRLGDGLPGFLDDVEGLPRPRLLQDLARLELASTFVFDEVESPTAGPGVISRFSYQQWDDLRFTPIRALRLVELSYPAHRYLEALRSDDTPPRLRPGRTRLVVYRRDFHVFYLPLSRPAYALLQSLCEGLTLGEAVQAMFDAGGTGEGPVYEWFRNWFTERLFQRVYV